MDKKLLNCSKNLKFKNTNGITLIALVITIIVLLILAGVSISMLAGQNGILTQAQNAKTATEQSGAKEKVELAVVSAMAQTNDGTLTIDNLKTEIKNNGGNLENSEFPTLANIDNNKFFIKSDGSVLNYKEMAKISGQEAENTATKDSFGNYVVVPAGFKVINTTENVTDGIVIEDVSHESTAGSQFVWIPVGDVIKDSNGNTETITLGRYVFNEDGTVNAELSKTEPEDQLQPYGFSSYFTEDLKNTSTTNTHAKDILAFRIKTINNHGYYIGRYEARKNGTQLTVKADDTVYNNVKQPESSELSRKMYNDSNFENDLVNSYAWDTAVYFLQTFDNRDNKDSLKPYSIQTSLNDSLASQGTNNLESNKQDIICNVYDMASNCYEWTTETYNTIYTCTLRGGHYDISHHCTSYRYDASTSDNRVNISFRVIIYL